MADSDEYFSTAPRGECSHDRPVFGCTGCITKSRGWWCPSCKRTVTLSACECGQQQNGPWPKCTCGHSYKMHNHSGCTSINRQKEYKHESKRCTCGFGRPDSGPAA